MAFKRSSNSAGGLQTAFDSGTPAQKTAFQSSVSGAASGVATELTFGGGSTTSVPAASSIYTRSMRAVSIEVTAGAGSTLCIAHVQATNDAATAAGTGSAWTTIGTVSLSAAGTATVPLNASYRALRVNVTSLAGGTASARVRDQMPLEPGAGIAVTNPQLSGIAPVGPYCLCSSGVPVVFPSSGTVGANGALSGIVALPQIYSSGCWMYFPAGAVYGGSAAGLYWTVMSSSTAGTIYDNRLSPGASPASTPGNQAAIVAAAPGSYTATASHASPGPVGVMIPGGAIGVNGAVEVYVMAYCNNSASVKTLAVALDNTQVANITCTNQRKAGIRRQFRNQNNQARQVFSPISSSGWDDSGLDGGVGVFSGTVDTAQNKILGVVPYFSTPASDYFVITDLRVTLYPGI